MSYSDEVTLTIRLPESLREAFTQACYSNDTSASQQLRALIRGYVAKNAQKDLFEQPKAQKRPRR